MLERELLFRHVLRCMRIFDVYRDICHSVEKEAHMRFCRSGNEIFPIETGVIDTCVRSNWEMLCT
jgi:hypothetical protein